MDHEDCPCGRDRDYDACCGPVINRAGPAITAEDLMRSRYTAFASGQEEHLAWTWHPDHRPPVIHVGDDREWLGLTIVKTRLGGMLDRKGEVEFVARYRAADAAETDPVTEVHENSHFTRLGDRWVYTSNDGGPSMAAPPDDNA